MRGSARLLIGNAMLVMGVLLFAAGHPQTPGEVLVFSPHWLGFPSAFGLIAKADGIIVAGNEADSAAIGRSSDPRFADKLYQAGALLVWRSPSFASCTTPVTPPTQS